MQEARHHVRVTDTVMESLEDKRQLAQQAVAFADNLAVAWC
jgi:hypothetical protein